jgi:glycosyltransferase involved in cell wall biosynthesis
MHRLANLDPRRGIELFGELGLSGIVGRLFQKPPDQRTQLVKPSLPLAEGTQDTSASTPETLSSAPASRSIQKTVLRLNLPREKVVDAFFEADLFVFASKVEYSPLVLFESAAAGTPFLTVPVGNAAEIVRWTGGGWLCPADVDDRGYTKVSPSVLAREMEKGIASPETLRKLGVAGRQAWLDRFTWAKIAKSYERILRGETVISSMQSDSVEGAGGG